jgi:phosphoribosyl 1,2-cyclic phosphodiesterase
MRMMGERLAQEDGPVKVDLIMTHIHLDHLLGFPFFAPLYREGSHLRVGGWPNGYKGLTSFFRTPHSLGLFPVSLLDLPSRLEYAPDLNPPCFTAGDLQVRTTPLNHPQGCCGYRFEEQRRAFTFITDNELEPGQPPPKRLVNFCRGCQALIHDAQNLPEDREIRRGWGHSDWETSLELARQAEVPRLILTHHDPARTDAQLDSLAQIIREAAPSGLEVELAYEGLEIKV